MVGATTGCVCVGPGNTSLGRFVSWNYLVSMYQSTVSTCSNKLRLEILVVIWQLDFRLIMDGPRGLLHNCERRDK